MKQTQDTVHNQFDLIKLILYNRKEKHNEMLAIYRAIDEDFATVTFDLKTYSGSTQIGSTSTKTATGTIRGNAKVNVGGVWKNGLAWVNVGGTWKKGLIYKNVSGTWKVGD